jgi:translation elongation factor EF-1alpha
MTLYVTTKTFETETRHITILDTPGHQELKQRMLKAAM